LRELAEEEAEIESKPLPVVEKPKGSPLYQRYMDIQNRYPDSVVAMRLGDFYEVFGENAVTLASELDLTLTGRDCGLSSRVPMIGFPYHAAEAYFSKIIGNHTLSIVESDTDIRRMSKQTVDVETGEILSEEEMREFDGDIVEPHDVPDDDLQQERQIATAFDKDALYKLVNILGNTFILR